MPWKNIKQGRGIQSGYGVDILSREVRRSVTEWRLHSGLWEVREGAIWMGSRHTDAFLISR